MTLVEPPGAQENVVQVYRTTTSVVSVSSVTHDYTLSEAWSGVNWADLMAALGAFGTDFYDRSILRPKHRAYTIVLVDLS